MELSTLSLNDFVKLGTVIWTKGYESVPQVARTSGLFREVSISENSGNTREFSSIDGEEYAAYKGEGDQAERARVQQGYTKTMTKYRVARDIGITYEMRKENKYTDVVSKLTNLGRQYPNTLDLNLSHRLTFGTATTYTDSDSRVIDISTGDTLQLFYSAHTLRGSSTTYRNRLANNPAFSQGSLESIERLAAEETYNQFGQKMAMPFDIIWSTEDPNTCNLIKQVLKSTSSVDVNNSGVTNVNQGKYRHVILPRLATDASGAPDTTKRKYWGIASSMYTTAYVGVWEEGHLKTPSDLNAGEEFSTDDWNFGIRGGHGICVVDAAWIKMSSGDGAA
jgi:hypothetical protein